MITIGLVDDDGDKRGTLLKTLKRTIKDESVAFVDIFPLDDPGDYISWIAQNQIHAIVIDWRLNEQSSGKGSPVKYQGDAIVKAIRVKLPYFPIFVLTAYATDDDVDMHDSDVELIEDRTEFGMDRDKLAKRLIRAASRFSESKQKQLSRVSELAKLCAIGKASTAQKKELRELQDQLQLGVVSDAALTQSEALCDAQNALDATNKLIENIEKKLAEKKA